MEKPFGTAQICPLGVDLFGNFPDGVYVLRMSWEEVAEMAKEQGDKVPSDAIKQAFDIAVQLKKAGDRQ